MHDGRNGGGPATRRDVLAALFSGGLAVGLSARGVAAAATTRYQTHVRGTVYEDVTGSGRRTACDRGIAGVSVSNGRDVTRTLHDGSWQLPMRDGDSIFVIKPAQWRMSCQPDAPQKFWKSARTIAAGPSDSIDFALERSAEADQFDVLLFADTQASTREELAFVRHDLVNATRGSTAAFALHHGDAMGDDLTLLPDYLEITRETGLPWHHCPGNHDMDLQAPTAASALEQWTQHVGPAHYAFEHGRAVFFVLNNVEALSPRAARHSDKPYRGRIGREQLAFVRSVLRYVPDDRLIVVSMHIPLVSFNDPKGDAATTADRARLLALLSNRPHSISFSGHSHTTEHHYIGRSDGFYRDRPHHHHVLTAVCGSWWSGERDAHGVPRADSRDGSPRGHHVLSIDGVKATTRFVPAQDAAASNQMRVMLCQASPDRSGSLVLAPERISRSDLSSLAVVADVFDGGSRTRVEFKSDASCTATAMVAFSTIDPYVAQSYARVPQLCKPWLEACPSSHIWQAALPLDLALGPQIIAVTATEPSGVAHHGELRFELV